VSFTGYKADPLFLAVPEGNCVNGANADTGNGFALFAPYNNNNKKCLQVIYSKALVWIVYIHIEWSYISGSVLENLSASK